MCYSDHDEDVRVKGSCDYCGLTMTMREYNNEMFALLAEGLG